jgi:hypothetical protein
MYMVAPREEQAAVHARAVPCLAVQVPPRDFAAVDICYGM